MNTETLWHSPLFGVSLTIGIYLGLKRLQGGRNWFNPSLLTGLAIMGLLGITGIPYEAYKNGGDLIVLILGPATVALGVPLYKQFGKIKSSLLPILSGITAGAVSSILSAAAFVWMARGAKEVFVAMLPKSVTSPVAIEIIRNLGGIPELGATFTVLTGVLGSLIGPEFLRFCRVRTDIGIGTAMGTASHGIGTSRVLPESELQGSLSGFAMGINCVITSILIVPFYMWLK